MYLLQPQQNTARNKLTEKKKTWKIHKFGEMKHQTLEQPTAYRRNHKGNQKLLRDK